MGRYTKHAFPPYTYVPRRVPHPLSDAHGHRCPGPAANAGDTANWADLEVYAWAIDLFNHGYYWEAHEAWESIWHLVGRTGEAGDFLKALIKLAAAGVKAHEGNLVGIHRHARRAAEIFAGLPDGTLGQLNVGDLQRASERVSKTSAAQPLDEPQAPKPALNVQLRMTA